MKILLEILMVCLQSYAAEIATGVLTGSKILDSDVPVIGIDLGMNYSSVGINQFGREYIIENERGNRIIPS